MTEHQLCHVDGRTVNTEIGSVKHDAGSSGMWLVAVVRNVTDRVQREAVERKLELTDLNRSKVRRALCLICFCCLSWPLLTSCLSDCASIYFCSLLVPLCMCSFAASFWL